MASKIEIKIYIDCLLGWLWGHLKVISSKVRTWLNWLLVGGFGWLKTNFGSYIRAVKTIMLEWIWLLVINSLLILCKRQLWQYGQSTSLLNDQGDSSLWIYGEMGEGNLTSHPIRPRNQLLAMLGMFHFFAAASHNEKQ